MHAAAEGPIRRRPPVPALLAVPFAVLSSLAVAFFGFLALAFSNGKFDGGGWLFVAVPAVLSVWLLVGALLLVLGRSWLAVFLPAAGLAVMLVWVIVAEGLAADSGGFAVVVWALPAATALLAVLPGVRRWIAVRKLARLAG